MEHDERQAEIDAILGDLDLTRDDAITMYRDFVDETGREVHEGVRRLERDSRRIRRDPSRADRLAHDEVAVEADRLAGLVLSYLSDLATLQPLGGAIRADVSVADIPVGNLEFRVRIAARALRAAVGVERTDASPTPMRTARAALDGALDVAERYVRAVAIRLGMTIEDPQGPGDD